MKKVLPMLLAGFIAFTTLVTPVSAETLKVTKLTGVKLTGTSSVTLVSPGSLPSLNVKLPIDNQLKPITVKR